MNAQNNLSYFSKACAEQKIELTERQLEQLNLYAQLLVKWNSAINLVAPSTINAIYSRHLLDSAQITPYITVGEKVLDVGSGGGLPALVIAIITGAEVVACERVGKKVQFMNQVRRELGLTNFSVEQCDIRDLPYENGYFDTVTARAFADLSDILDLTLPYLKPSGRYLLLKGEKSDQEISRAKLNYTLQVTKNSSITESGGAILEINSVSRETSK